MLRKLDVRTRLIAVLAVPLVLLLAVAVPELLERRGQARDADRAAALTGSGAALAATVEALQGERTLAAVVRAGGARGATGALRDQRALTDSTTGAAQIALGRIASMEPDLTAAVTAVTDDLRAIEDVREESDLAESIVPWVDPFEPLITSLLDLQEDLGSVVTDSGTSSALTEAALLARSKDAASSQAAHLAAALVWGELRGGQVTTLTGLRADEQAFRTAYLATGPAAERVERRAAVAEGAATTAGRLVEAVIREEGIGPLDDLDAWLAISAERQVVLRDVEAARAADALELARTAGDDARRASTGYLVVAGVGLVLALGLAALAARSITRPLRRLTEAADDLAGVRLPKLVDALRDPGEVDARYLAAGIETIEVRSDDELAHLAKAFNAVQSVAVEVAAEQAALLRKGISDLYVNLARRNQALIERQIQLLDRLEGGEQDPEVLQHLYLLDHLATRMRRNAESLLVLAGSESGPRRAQPAPTIDVLRAALSEVEEYERIDLGAVAEGMLHGPAVTDVAHILAELIENATHFSPPESLVRVDGVRSGGSYQIVITDHGVGMAAEQLAEVNDVLDHPPVTGLALGRSLGCLVAGRLAARHGITVRLRQGESGGIVAYVILPRILLVDDVAQLPLAPPADTASSLPVAGSSESAMAASAGARDPWLDDWDTPAEPDHDAPEPVRAAPAATPARTPAAAPDAAPATAAPAEPATAADDASPAWLREAIPARAVFDDGLRAILEGSGSARLIEPPVDRPVAADHPAGDAGVHPSTEPEPAAPRRSPEEVRALLSRYRSGLRAGRGNDRS